MDSPIDLTNDSDQESSAEVPSSAAAPSPDLLLLIYVHGFKGTDVTFESFPSRLEYLVQQTIPRIRCQTHVFPVYETRGSLLEATERFVDWLTHLTVSAENAHAELGIGGAGKAKIVLCGHSMGGLLIVDAVLKIREHAVDKEGPLWPRTVGVIGFDSPYLGLSPGVFRNSISKYASHVSTARTVLGAIATPAAAAAGSSFGFGSGSDSATASPPASRAGSGSNTPQRSEAEWANTAGCAGGDDDGPSGNAKAGGSGSGFGSGWGFSGWGSSQKSRSPAGGTSLGTASSGEGGTAKARERPDPDAIPSRSAVPPVEQTQPTSSRWWTPALPNIPTTALATIATISAVAAAAAGTAYYKRQDLAMGWGWVSDHILYVSNLWDSEGMKQRGRGLLDLVQQSGKEGEEVGGEDDMDVEIDGLEGSEGTRARRAQERVVYRNFYTDIPPDAPNFLLSRTFCILPSPTHALRPFWRPVTSSFAEDEVSAHLGMFNAKTNEAFYPMGLEVARTVIEAVERARTIDRPA